MERKNPSYILLYITVLFMAVLVLFAACGGGGSSRAGIGSSRLAGAAAGHPCTAAAVAVIRQDRPRPRGSLQFARDSVLPTDLHVLGILNLTGFSDAAELRHEQLGRRLAETRRGEDTGFETANRMNRREQVPPDLQVVDSDSNGSRGASRRVSFLRSA